MSLVKQSIKPSRYERNIKNANLEFFEAKFLNAGLGVNPTALVPPTALHLSFAHSIGVIESTLWLRLGIELDFFDTARVIEKLLSIEHELMSFWKRLEGLPEVEQRCDFLTTEKGFDKERFQSPQLGPEWVFLSKHLELVKQEFLSHLLLASETIFDPSTTHFLDIISAQRTKQLEQLRGDADFYTGFANQLRYLTDFYEFPYPNSCGDDAEGQSIVTLASRILNIIRRRIIIDSEPARTRCFELSGDLMASIKRPEPEWFAMRDSVLHQLDWVTRPEEDVRYNRDLKRGLFLAHSDGLKVGFTAQADIAPVR